MSYRDFYCMQDEAFGSLPVLNLFYGARTHQDCWRYLLRGIAAREPFLLVAGDYGMGKTLLSMMLVRLLKKKDFPLVQITDPHCGFSGILRQTGVLLGIDAHIPDEETLLTEVYARLNARDSRQVISIIIDDAQELGVAALVRLRAFANFNREGFFPVQLIFFAHPSFASLLKDPQLVAMDQRIKRRHRLTPLTMQETREYIYFRLVKSGAPGAPFFADDALREIHFLTGGVPRLINNICDACLTRGAFRLETGITLETVREARSDQAESFVPRVVAAARLGGTEPPDRFSAPPVHIAQPQQAGEEPTGTAPEHASVTARSRKIWLPVSVAAVLALFFIVRLYTPGTPPGPILSRDLSHQAVLPEQPIAADPAVVEEAVLPEQVVAADPAVVEEALLPEQVVAADPAVVEEALLPEQVVAADPAVVEEALLPEQVVAADPAVVEEAVLPEQVVAADPAVVEEAVLPEQVVAAAPAVVDTALVSGQPVEPADVFGGIASVPDEGRPFTLRLGCFNSPESARTAAALYTLNTLEPFIARVNLQQQGRWWIFYAGSFVSYEEAKRIREQLVLPDADIISMPYACRIGVFDSATVETDLLTGIEKLGCAPYMLENDDGTFSLFAGLYRHYDNAETLRKALADIHIDSTVVLLCPGIPPPIGKGHTGVMLGPTS